MIITKPVEITGMVEVVRSFAYKLNAEEYGGNRYESRDFFCSQKAQCAAQDAEKISALLHRFCRDVVLHDVGDYIHDLQKQRAMKKAEAERK